MERHECLTDDELAEIERLCEGATPGPWLTPQEAGSPYRVEVIDHEGCQVWPWRNEEDMRFAYRGRTLFPKLLAAYKALKQKVGE